MDQEQQTQPRGPFQDGGVGGNKPLVEAMSIISLTNKCFKKCIVPQTPRQHQQTLDQQADSLNGNQGNEFINNFNNELHPKHSNLTPKTRGVLEYLQISNHEQENWLLAERETVCMHNCAKSYVELKGFMHEQLLKDYSFVRKKNRKLFENL